MERAARQTSPISRPCWPCARSLQQRVPPETSAKDSDSENHDHRSVFRLPYNRRAQDLSAPKTISKLRLRYLSHQPRSDDLSEAWVRQAGQCYLWRVEQSFELTFRFTFEAETMAVEWVYNRPCVWLRVDCYWVRYLSRVLKGRSQHCRPLPCHGAMSR